MNRAEKRRQQKLAKKSGRLAPLPQSIQNTINIALQHHKAGRLEQAKPLYLGVLKTQPNEPGALHFLGLIAHQEGAEETALEYLTKSVQAKPDYADAHSNRGIVLKELGRLDEAILSYQKALHLNPNFADAHYNLGNAFTDLDRHNDAVDCYRKTLTIKPDYMAAHYNLGRSLGKLGLLDEAVVSYEKALALKPDYVIAHTGLGNVLNDQGWLDQSIEHFKIAISLAPDDMSAHDNLLLTEQYRYGQNAKSLYDLHHKWGEEHGQGFLDEWPSHKNERDPDRRLRVGFVSSDLGRHPVGYFVRPLLANLPKNQIQTFCYSDRQPDDLTQLIKTATNIWRDTKHIKDDQLRQIIIDDEIDILIDLAGHSAGNRLQLFARKPAPLQVAWAGYVGTTGLSAIDYLVSDQYSTPAGEDVFYQEKILRMPDGWLCYEPPDYAPEIGPLPYDCKGHISFSSFSNPAKINHSVAAVWTRILDAVPGSSLLIKYKGIETPTANGRLRALFEAEGLASSRLILEGRSPHADLLKRYGEEIDIALDPFPYSGGLTTYEALWMGVPVITVPGQTFASRHSQSHLTTIGLPELVAKDYDDYVARAVDLASDIERLRSLRARLRSQMANSPACDGEKFAKGFTNLMRSIWKDWCRTR